MGGLLLDGIEIQRAIGVKRSVSCGDKAGEFFVIHKGFGLMSRTSTTDKIAALANTLKIPASGTF